MCHAAQIGLLEYLDVPSAMEAELPKASASAKNKNSADSASQIQAAATDAKTKNYCNRCQ